jgi:uridine kinase
MLVVGISGATCSGKTTICNILRRIFVNSRVFNQDDYYWKEDSPHHIRDENSIINWEVMSGFDMKTMYKDIKEHINKSQGNEKKYLGCLPDWKVEDVFSNPDSFEHRIDPAKFQHVNLVLVEGILVLNDARISDLCDYRFFLELDYDTCWDRRKHRTYDPQDQVGYFTKYAWPYYLSNKKEFETLGRPVTYLDGTQSIQQNLCNVLNAISSSSSK